MKLRAPAAFARVPAGACSSTRMLAGAGYNVHDQVLGNRCKVLGNQVLGTLYQVVSQEVQVVPAVEHTQAVSTSLKSNPTAVNILTRGTLTSLSQGGNRTLTKAYLVCSKLVISKSICKPYPSRMILPCIA